jgi:hypothetical protein
LRFSPLILIHLCFAPGCLHKGLFLRQIGTPLYILNVSVIRVNTFFCMLYMPVSCYRNIIAFILSFHLKFDLYLLFSLTPLPLYVEFKSRVKYFSIVDPSQMAYYRSEILDDGLQGPLLMLKFRF